ncbi:restriction endonuclease [Treponema phagedenis]|uniref:restriction endonuclease subunit S n=1 Tax=Treponema phagedenis TaxID=162 RepID=UPI0011E7BBA8|nr:restriction endonuclease subunit S [Treponema phagedenis]QEJ95225.1 restriction endonuclease [Treponema phagedenis]
MSKRLSLNDVEWGEFRIKELFDVKGTVTTHPSVLIAGGKTPRITCAGTNNALDNFYKNNPTEKGEVLTVDSATDGYVFYQKNDFLATDHVEVISRKDDKPISKELGLFLKSVIDKSKGEKFGYGYKFSQTRIRQQIIKIPVDQNGEPNWQFMEDYIKQEQKIIAQKVIDYYEQKMLETAFDLVGLEDVKWKNFKLGSLFTFERKPSKGLNHLDTDKNRGISYLGATNKNNGVLEFVDPISNLVYRGNCIAFIRNGEGSMGYSVYKKENFMATQDISVGYNENLNQYNGMFITTVADRVRGKYNFGYKRNQSRLENEILTLPADKNGNPHWEYMSKFMQKLEVEKISNFLPYIYIYI